MAGLISNGFLAPPTVFIVLCLAGALLALVWRRLGIAVALASSLCLFVLATPVVSTLLLQQVEAGIPPRVDFTQAQAIVVLGGEVRIGNGADIPDTLGPISLERVLWGAQAYRRLGLPVAVSGGQISAAHTSEGALMKRVLEADFAVPVAFNEDRSATTWENAVYTTRLLQPGGIRRVIVVTQAWHLPRALWSFRRVGLDPYPWPVPGTVLRARGIGDFLPETAALQDSARALHELIGGIYYRWRY